MNEEWHKIKEHTVQNFIDCIEKLMKKKNSFEINSVNRHTSFAKIQEALKIIDELIEDYETVHKVYVISSHSGGSSGARATNKATVTKKTIDNLEKIKKILED